MEQEAEELLCGACDLHTHPMPSHVGRSADDFELLEQAEQAWLVCC